MWSLVIGPRSPGTGGAIVRAVTRQSARARTLALEFVLEALDLLFLAIHVPDVVAQKQVQILVAGARQLLFDRLELEQQIVAESSHQAQPRILFAAELLDQCPQNRKCRWLFAPLFLGKQRGEWFQPACQRLALKPEIVPVRMI